MNFKIKLMIKIFHFANFFQGTDNMDAYAPNVTRKIKPSTSCSFNAINNPNSFYNNRNRYVTESETNVDIPLMDDDDNINIIEGGKYYF